MISPMSIHGGIDLGGTKIQAAIVDDDHDVLGSARRATPTSGGPADVAAEMEAALRDAAASAGVEIAALAGVAVGSPGTIEGSSVRSARNLPGWEGSFPLGETLQAALGCEVRVGNDVQVATAAEFALGAGRPYRSLLGVFWGTGVGGGLIIDGQVWRGRGGAFGSGATLSKFDLKTRKLDKLADNVASFDLSANGEKMLLRIVRPTAGAGGRRSRSS